MNTRRSFIALTLAASAAPALSWAEAGGPAFLAAAREPDGGFALFGITAAGAERFRVPLPARGHAAAAHPTRAEAVAFARRPGAFALVLDCATGAVRHRLEAPAGRHFYGHGAFSRDGRVLYTTENEIESGQGVIGLWLRDEGYARIGEVASGGIGPHEIVRLPGEEVLAVANGGIRTHPDHGRDKLNLPTMRPNLSYLAPDGDILEQVALDDDLHRNSIRHLATGPDGLVAFAMQWQGDPAETVPLLGLHRRGGAAALAWAPGPEQVAMRGYAGSVAIDAAGRRIAITSPRGSRVHVFDAEGGFTALLGRADVCGIGPAADGFVTTDGMGGVGRIASGFTPTAQFDRAWDNHLVPVRS